MTDGYKRAALGELAERMFEIECLKRGYVCCKPVSHMAYDYLIDRGHGWERVQIKRVSLKEKKGRNYYNTQTVPKSGRQYSPNDVDILCGVADDGTIWEWNIAELEGVSVLCSPVDPLYKTDVWHSDDRRW